MLGLGLKLFQVAVRRVNGGGVSIPDRAVLLNGNPVTLNGKFLTLGT